MYKDLKIKFNKFVIKAKQNLRDRELQLLRRNHRRSTNTLHNKLESYKPLETLYEIDDLEEVTTNNLKTDNIVKHYTDDKKDKKKNFLDRYKNGNKIKKICSNIFGATIVCDLIVTDITF